MLLRWREPRARLLAVMACFPQRLWFYDQLPLWLTARTWQEATFLTLTSWVGYWGWRLTAESPVWSGSDPASAPVWVVSCIYLPALLLLLLPSFGGLRTSYRYLASRVAATRLLMLRRSER